MKNPCVGGGWLKRGVSVGMSAVLAATLLGTAPAAAFASETDVVQKWSAAAELVLDDQESSYSYAGSDEPVALSDDNVETTSSERRYSLYDLGYVTPAKKQAPWNDCWAFGTIAAAETSILSKAAQNGIDLGDFDLSERALVNLVYSATGVPESVAGSAQAGEAASDYGKNSSRFDVGGRVYYCMTLFSAGIGIVPESMAPYQNEEGIIVCEVTESASASTQTMYMTQAQIDEYKASHPDATVVLDSYAGFMKDEQDKRTYTNWDTDDSLWAEQAFTLKDANVLPSVRVLKIDEGAELPTYQFTDTRAVAALKSELKAGRGVSAGYFLDETNSEANPISKYFDRYNWSHYTWASNSPNHRVCIVGWDDNYDKSNFVNSEGKTPQGNGAWIVKQSAGANSENQDFQNNSEWGITNADGEHTGYFYLSYYDQSLDDLVSFDFDLDGYGSADECYSDQYDFLPERDAIASSSDEPVSTANIFTAQGDMALRTVGCATYKENTTVTYQVYLLDDEAATPTDPEHSQLVCTVEDTYAYGGRHRTTLDSDKWVAMRKGQRYAVVTTQKCNDNGKWYQGVTCNVSFFKDVLNEKESWTGTTKGSTASSASAQTEWTDWTAVKKGIQNTLSWGVDNASVKAFSEIRSFASVEELDSLAAAIQAAKAALASAKTSADGSDVATSDTWMTQAQRDALSAAIEDAEARLALAGVDYATTLANTTPSSNEVTESVASLSFDVQAGAKADVQKQQANSKTTKANGTYAKTSDGAGVTIAALDCVTAIAAAAIVVSLRRRRKHE